MQGEPGHQGRADVWTQQISMNERTSVYPSAAYLHATLDQQQQQQQQQHAAIVCHMHAFVASHCFPSSPGSQLATSHCLALLAVWHEPSKCTALTLW